MINKFYLNNYSYLTEKDAILSFNRFNYDLSLLNKDY